LECAGGLYCAQDVGADYGWRSDADVCEQIDEYPGNNYCTSYGPCKEGIGDCDEDSQCASGLKCVNDVGADYGWPSNVDVCDNNPGCGGGCGQPGCEKPCDYPGDDYCTVYGPCSEGLGDCDANSECAGDLICAQDVGADYGWPALVDVCEKVSCGGL
jgi:hypothetical protein